MPLDSPTRHDPGSPRLEARLRRELQGEVLFDLFSRGRYSTDASIYQIEPLGVVVPKDRAESQAEPCAESTTRSVSRTVSV